MEALLAYLNSLPQPERTAFAERCGTTEGYLRSAASSGKRLGIKFVIAIERESGGKVRAEDLQPDVDWAFFRSRKRGKAA